MKSATWLLRLYDECGSRRRNSSSTNSSRNKSIVVEVVGRSRISRITDTTIFKGIFSLDGLERRRNSITSTEKFQ